MDFALVITVLLTYFIRPQDWVPGLSGMNIMNLLMAGAIVATFLRKDGFSLANVLKTPLDWAVLAYTAYLVWAAPSGQKPVVPACVFFAYYLVTSQALTTPERLTKYLRFWLVGLLTVAGMAVASEYGLDLTGAKEITHAVPELPRLVLNTYLFNNANSLGHSVVIAIPLAYFLLFRNMPMHFRIAAILAVVLAVACVYMTKSKGAFVVGFAVIVAALIQGRPIVFQLIILLLAITLGLQGLQQMPRMANMDRLRQDEAVMGRMLAWEKARLASKAEPYGEGFRTFKPIIEWEDRELIKATHSSYVLIGAELGPRGMLFYLAVLYASLRILITTRCRNTDDEMSRRALISILLAYLASNWLIDRSYHLEYFFLAGAVSAFHRRIGKERGALPGEELETESEALLSTLEQEETKPTKGESREAPNQPPASDSESPTIMSPEDVDTSDAVKEAIDEQKFRFWYWRRWGLLDLVLVFLFSKVIFDTWDRLLDTYFLS